MKKLFIISLFATLFLVSCTKEIYHQEYDNADITLEKKGSSYVLTTNEYKNEWKTSTDRCVLYIKSEDFATKLVNNAEKYSQHYHRYFNVVTKDSELVTTESKNYIKDNLVVNEFIYHINK